MLDSINLERRGIPATVLGVDRLFNTTGRGMARAQGYPNLQFATYAFSHTALGGGASEEELMDLAKILAPQVERILTGSGQAG